MPGVHCTKERDLKTIRDGESDIEPERVCIGVSVQRLVRVVKCLCEHMSACLYVVRANVCVIEREGGGGGERQIDTETDRQTDRQTERLRDRQTDRQADRQTETELESDIQTERQRQRGGERGGGRERERERILYFRG